MNNVSVHISSVVLEAVSDPNNAPVFVIEAFQVGYVFCRQSPRYGGSGGGWRPDPLLPIATAGFSVPRAVLQSIWIRVSTPVTMPQGNYTAQVTVLAGTTQLFTVPLFIEVWGHTMPTLRQSHIGTAWSGEWSPEYFAPYYPNSSWQKNLWFDMLVRLSCVRTKEREKERERTKDRKIEKKKYREKK